MHVSRHPTLLLVKHRLGNTISSLTAQPNHLDGVKRKLVDFCSPCVTETNKYRHVHRREFRADTLPDLELGHLPFTVRSITWLFVTQVRFISSQR